MRTLLASCLVIVTTVALSYPSHAQSEDAQYVRKCVQDSAGMAASQEVKLMYCTCMVGKMSATETRSVTQWEQANVAEARECAHLSGWR
jgi:hypothetical protein